MTLVDTSIWIDHFRRGNTTLVEMLNQTTVATHELIIGELACGNLRARSAILGLLAALPRVLMPTPTEVLAFIEHHRLYGRGLGWVDANLLAGAVAAATPLWTHDARLADAALRLGVLYAP